MRLQRVFRPNGSFLRWEHAGWIDVALEAGEERLPARLGGGAAVGFAASVGEVVTTTPRGALGVVRIFMPSGPGGIGGTGSLYAGRRLQEATMTS
jgi:hypothetical protein